MLVASMTTLPSRAHRLEPVIEAIAKQTLRPDYLQLNIPKLCARDSSPYVLPSFLINNKFVRIHWLEHDLGPVTKVLPTLHYLKQEGASGHVISVDDDIHYPDYWFETLLDQEKTTSVSCGKLGVFYQRQGKVGLRCNADPSTEGLFQILQGFTSIVYPLDSIPEDFFDYVEFVLQDDDARCSDDLFISYYCYQKGISVYFNPLMHRDSLKELKYAEYGFDSFALHKQGEKNDNHVLKYFRALKICKAWFTQNDLPTKEMHMQAA